MVSAKLQALCTGYPRKKNSKCVPTRTFSRSSNEVLPLAIKVKLPKTLRKELFLCIFCRIFLLKE